MSSLPATENRVPAHSPRSANVRIEREAIERITRAIDNPSYIAARLTEMDREWDVERTLEANAATVAFIGVALGAFVSPWFLLLPAAVTAFLLQHALQGWCPPLPVFRSFGVRTAGEIARERVALKLLRGDFAVPPSRDDTLACARSIWAAAAL